MSIENLQGIEDKYEHTLEEQTEIEEKVQEQIESMVEDTNKADTREQLDDLNNPEFQDLAENILDQI